MLPEGAISTIAVVAATVDPAKTPGDFLVDYERGGVALNDQSQGLLVKLWTLRVVKVDNLQEARVSAPGVAETVLFTSIAGITEASLAFDQNMNPFVAFVEGGVAKYWFYDTVAQSMQFATLPAGSRNPRCCLDEKRSHLVSGGDILLAYVRAGNLCILYQRERYLIENVLTSVGTSAELVSMAMNRSYRIQWRLRKVTASAGQFSANANPYLADVVLDLCARVGIGPTKLWVGELYGANDIVHGYGVSTSDGVDKILKPLAQAFFFDPTEHDYKLRFIKRGKSPVVRITFNDLVADTPHSMKKTRRQEDKLPRLVSVNHIDPDGGYAKNKQSAMRRSNLVKTKSELKIDLGIVMPANQAAGVADKTIKMKWHELMDYSFSLPIAFSYIVPTTVIEFQDKAGNVERIRIEERNMDGNVIKFKGPQDGGAATYNTNAVGLSLPTPTSTTPGLIGATNFELLNIPVLRDQDDELGIYIGAAGSTSAWYGYQLLVSSDGGLNYFEALRSESPATLGETVTPLLAEISAEYPAAQSVVVTSNFPLESVTPESLFTNSNRCVIGDEVLQFETAEHLGLGQYRLSGLVRGRLATPPAAWPAGTRFVLLDSAVTFMQAQQWMLGKELLFKPVSFGTTEDETIATAYQFDTAASQTEWAPDRVSATRDGSNNTVVTFIGRGRLGIETSPYNSKYFTGYRIKYSDGFSVDTLLQTYTRSATPVAVTITVHGLNSITGEGPASSGVLI